MKKYLVTFVDRARHGPLTVEANVDVTLCMELYYFKKGDEKVAYVHEDRVLSITKIEE